MRDKAFYKLANETFQMVSPDYSNAKEISNQAKKVFLRRSIVSCLENFEKQDIGINWWQDEDLMKVFERMNKAGVYHFQLTRWSVSAG
ncbi:hypothetical protein A2572_01915 [Candidatus Collierbacteria bacterium RIFOXYD1_FULL_40_9]|uniref:Uncharacterized protein n=1 Tax=Candidatus Collierbacteria bacterium RIFOXYD1_FULL_40_9 TaxID=1817731 RepID=A0A1F5FUA4_9BACT|nr:MAG: hypothetical protein A2572_01915 [Candidatus Collierbacteria bacterium RIFOXYD1_FULL_40_9]